MKSDILRQEESLRLKPECGGRKRSQYGSQLEREVYEQLQQAGWNVKVQTSPLLLPRDGVYSYDVPLDDSKTIKVFPDFTLVDDEGHFIGIVEVKCVYNAGGPMLKDTVIRMKWLIENVKPPIVIITNGYVYDIYFRGTHYAQTHFCPSPSLYEALKRREVAPE